MKNISEYLEVQQSDQYSAGLPIQQSHGSAYGEADWMGHGHVLHS